MGQKIGVFVVDDSSAVRRMLTEILSSDEKIDVVGTVGNAELALARIDALGPDVVTLDIELPGMNGLDLLVAIRKRHPKLPVIMFSALTARAGATTLEALSRGATDYVTKPTGAASAQAAQDQVKEQLIPKIKALVRPEKSTAAAAPVVPKITPHVGGRVELLAIGSSTGGPNALTELFAKMPRDLPVPVVIVQHMPPLFTKLLAERLTTSTKIPFQEAIDGQELVTGRAYIAPGDYHLYVVRSGKKLVAKLNQAPQENSCRPSVDVLFRSVADVVGRTALGVILTGMGQDGLRGCTQIHQARGRILAQDEASSVVWGMPGFVARAGIAEGVYALEELPNVILQYLQNDRALSASEVARAS